MQKNILINQILGLLKGIYFDPDLSEYKDDLLNVEELEKQNHNHYETSLIIDLQSKEISYFHENFAHITGYENNKVNNIDLESLLEKIKPTEQEEALNYIYILLNCLLIMNVKDINNESFFIYTKLRNYKEEYHSFSIEISIHSEDKLENIVHLLLSFTHLSYPIEKTRAFKSNIELSTKEICIEKNKDKKLDLTPALFEILVLLSNGLTVKEIAAKRNTKENTIYNQIKELYQKFNANNRTKLLYIKRDKLLHFDFQ